MTATHLAALIERLHPGRSVRQLTEDAGLAENKISYYLKPGTTLTRIPPTATVNEVARALRCDPLEVVRAFAADVGLPWGDGALADDDRDVLRMVHRLPARYRRAMFLLAVAMLDAQDDDGAPGP